jgi:large subunit ribosomal protein L17
MRHRHHRHQLSRPTGHRLALMRNLATALITHGKIKTTHAKARALRPYAERLVTLARRGGTHAQRQAFSRLGDKEAVKRLFTEIGPQHADRPGGYTRITKIGPRGPYGDSAAMSVIELIGPEAGAAPKDKPKRRRRKKATDTKES